MNEECIRVLCEFQHLTEFVQQAKREGYRIDGKLLQLLK
jgi:hypothetical protein